MNPEQEARWKRLFEEFVEYLKRVEPDLYRKWKWGQMNYVDFWHFGEVLAMFVVEKVAGRDIRRPLGYIVQPSFYEPYEMYIYILDKRTNRVHDYLGERLRMDWIGEYDYIGAKIDYLMEEARKLLTAPRC
jgi:hypothetical protein